MLKSIAEAVNAYGCVLWQITTAADPGKELANERLFVLSDWFRGEHPFVLYDLPLHNSVTGISALGQKTVNIEDIWSDPRVFTEDPFLKKAHIKSICCVPISFHDGVRGVLNIYRNSPPPFSDGDIKRVERLAALVPPLYQAIRDEVSLSLIARVTQLLHTAGVHRPGDVNVKDEGPMTKEEIKGVIQKVCKLVADSFQCIETTIFLENHLKEPGSHELVATTVKGLTAREPLRASNKGATAWVLRNVRPVRLFDLAHFERDKDMIHSEYPGLDWADGLNIETKIPDTLRTKFGGELPPLSYMAAPVVSGKKVYGVIRCSVADRSPYYFSERDLALLQLIAIQISQSWSHWLSKCELQEESRSWEAFVKKTGGLNRFVDKRLKSGIVEMEDIYDHVLKGTAEVIEGAEILDVRVLDKDKGALKFASTYGAAWAEGSEDDVRTRLQKTFSIKDLSPTSAGAYVFREGITYVIANVHERLPYFDSTFNQTTCMIIAPIRVKDDIIGVLDIRGTGPKPFPKHAEHMAALIGQQIGLYRHLATNIGELHKAKTTLDAMQKAQLQVIQDLTHQFKTPINQAYARLSRVIDQNLKGDKALLAPLWPIRGLTAKAKRVNDNMGLFSDLAHGKPISVTNYSLPLDASGGKLSLLKLLKEANSDAMMLIDPTEVKSVYVDEETFYKAGIKGLEVDVGLLEQALGDILDNAIKYSSPDTKVRVYGGWTGGGRAAGGRFHISVENKGKTILASEVTRAVERGWQRETAASRGGRGIGLWIVDNIMKAHNGQLVIMPTKDKVTDVKLIFPTHRIK
jgi:GAF domain-containing protein